ncbi:MAG: 5'-methylthioadenosine/S-adenosylhomocysteine nucleosidase [Clostridia bacterium]|nr:5'-methylthioadenosine/S-adenosylhomocysteine nucleosidase [Clostridia bacterium]
MERPILIQGAEETEINYLRNILDDVEEKKIGNHIFWTGKIDNYPVVLSKTNVGLISSAKATTIGAINFSPIAIFNQGTAGGHGKKVKRGDIVIGRDYINLTSFRIDKRDEGEGTNLDGWRIRAFYTDDIHHEYNKADERLMELAYSEKNEYKDGEVRIGRIGSGDIWNREADRILYLNSKYGTLCEEMETASVYSVAKDFNIPVVGIRIISNNEVLKQDYKKELATDCQKYVEKVVRKYIKEIE